MMGRRELDLVVGKQEVVKEAGASGEGGPTKRPGGALDCPPSPPLGCQWLEEKRRGEGQREKSRRGFVYREWRGNREPLLGLCCKKSVCCFPRATILLHES